MKMVHTMFRFKIHGPRLNTQPITDNLCQGSSFAVVRCPLSQYVDEITKAIAASSLARKDADSTNELIESLQAMHDKATYNLLTLPRTSSWYTTMCTKHALMQCCEEHLSGLDDDDDDSDPSNDLHDRMACLAELKRVHTTRHVYFPM
jgi:hypothetical protein